MCRSNGMNPTHNTLVICLGPSDQFWTLSQQTNDHAWLHSNQLVKKKLPKLVLFALHDGIYGSFHNKAILFIHPHCIVHYMTKLGWRQFCHGCRGGGGGVSMWASKCRSQLCILTQSLTYTGWPRKNATPTINNFKKTRDKMKKLCIYINA